VISILPKDFQLPGSPKISAAHRRQAEGAQTEKPKNRRDARASYASIMNDHRRVHTSKKITY
jgi:hypothetical protein